jgi:hypothetical protein
MTTALRIPRGNFWSIVAAPLPAAAAFCEKSRGMPHHMGHQLLWLDLLAFVSIKIQPSLNKIGRVRIGVKFKDFWEFDAGIDRLRGGQFVVRFLDTQDLIVWSPKLLAVLQNFKDRPIALQEIILGPAVDIGQRVNVG